MSINRSSYAIGTLIKITTPQNNFYRYQNFYQEDNGIFNFNLEEYRYLPIYYDPPNRNITADNQDVQIKIPLTPTTIQVTLANDFFRYSTADAFVLPVDFPSSPAIAQDKLVISSYQIVDSDSDGGIILIAQSPFNAVNGNFPNLVYISGRNTGLLNGIAPIGYIPEVPQGNAINL